MLGSKEVKVKGYLSSGLVSESRVPRTPPGEVFWTGR
jgi:hypothetical protein